MGQDPISGKNFDHRKQWMDQKIELQAAHFGIDLLGQSILSNHFHLVLRSRPDVVATWKDKEVARRWMMLCPKRKKSDGTPRKPTKKEIRAITGDAETLKEIRSRLSDISWWVRLLCQYIAQRANRETGEKGKFWQDRFHATRLLDDSAVLACVAYVDLNPIRAELASTLEKSDFTSAQKRLEALLLQSVSSKTDETEAQPGRRVLRDRSLAPVHVDELRDELGPCPSRSGTRCSDKGFVHLTGEEYLQLLDWTARQKVAGKRGTTPADAPPLLERVGLRPASWLTLVSDFGRLFRHVAGRPAKIASTLSRQTKRSFRVQDKVMQAFAAT
jgi:REP element-mobilizing transposase RayT